MVHFVNDPPVIDLDSDNSAASGSAYAAVFIEDGNPVAIADTDAVLSDIDSTTVELLTANNAGTGIITTHNDGVLMLRGNRAVSEYEQVLRTILYRNSSQVSDGTARIIEFVATDGTGDSNTAITIVTVNPVNDVPFTDGIGDVAIQEDAADSFLNLFAAFGDPENADADLVFILEGNTNPALFASMNIDGGSGTLTLDFAPDAGGVSVITVRATDRDGLSVETAFTVTVVAINDAPSAGGDVYAIDEDLVLIVNDASGVLAKDVDVERIHRRHPCSVVQAAVICC